MVQRFTESMVRTIVEDDTNHEYSLIHLEKTGKKDKETGKSKKREMSIRHNECGHVYTVPLYEFTDGKRRCAKCKGKKLREHFVESIESIKEKTLALTDGEYEFVDTEYVNSKTKHKFLHTTCKTIFKKRWDKFKGTPKQPGQRCTECVRKGMESSASRHVRDILDNFNIDYEREHTYSDCINPETSMLLRFDYYLPAINTIIEVDGEQHERATHTTWDLEGTIKRDKMKNHYAEEKGIELIRIPAKKWSQLPKFLHSILSKELLKDLTLQEIKDVPISNHQKRINADLKRFHNAEYALNDKFYHGVDRLHEFKHKICGTLFSKSYQALRTEAYPCPTCRRKYIQQDKHDRSNKELTEKTQGRYTLDDSSIGVDDKGRRLAKCHQCNHSWRVTVGNLMKGTAGCPKCFQRRKDMEWQQKYDEIIKVIKNGGALDKSQKHWLWQNKRKYSEGGLNQSRLELLQKENLL